MLIRGRGMRLSCVLSDFQSHYWEEYFLLHQSVEHLLKHSLTDVTGSQGWGPTQFLSIFQCNVKPIELRSLAH